MPIYNSWKYFPKNKGLMGGIVVGGFGFGAFVFNFVSTAVVNPNHLEAENGYFPLEVANNVPKMIRVLCLSWLGLSIIGIAMIFPYKEEVSNIVDLEKMIEAPNINLKTTDFTNGKQ